MSKLKHLLQQDKLNITTTKYDLKKTSRDLRQRQRQENTKSMIHKYLDIQVVSACFQFTIYKFGDDIANQRSKRSKIVKCKGNLQMYSSIALHLDDF